VTDYAPRMRWWGWGRDGGRASLSPAAESLLTRELDLPHRAGSHPVALEDVELPEPGLTASARGRLEGVVGEENVREGRLARVSHAGGRSYPDLLRLRAGDARVAPDAVVFPGSREEVARVLNECSAARIGCVPFGGGTSVVGGVEPRREGVDAVVSLDMVRMARVLDVDERSLVGTFEPGLTGPGVEEELARHGLTLGHFPQSFEYATLGGFVATRSAGQASTGYGRIDELVLGLTCTTPVGEVSAHGHPASAAGPALRELLVGSEGVLGVITEVTLALRRAASTRRYEAWSFRSFDDGLAAFRAMEQQGVAPDVARLSDEEETRLTVAMAATSPGTVGDLARRGAGAYLRVRGHASGCLAILGFEGDPRDVAHRRARCARLLRREGSGLPLGGRPGRAWRRGRFRAPYLRDELLDRGVMVDTLETATTWNGLPELHRRVGDALRSALSGRGTPPLVMCHVSHLYRSGGSLYYTFLARQERGSEIEQWQAAKVAATDAILAGGGTLTHHHAVGTAHAPWMREEVGDLGLAVLQAAKARLDPRGIMNPGKLLPRHEGPAVR
jgi:alkyldihydroxyacetonephosphate synthase